MVAVYAPTGVSVNEASYAKLHAVVDAVPKSDTLIVLGDFSATTDTSRDGYGACVGPHGSGRRDFLNANGVCKKPWLEDSWIVVPEIGSEMLDGVTRKKIDHVLVSGRWFRTAGRSKVPSFLVANADC